MAEVDVLRKAIERVEVAEAEAAKAKRLVNQICELLGREPMYAEAAIEEAAGMARPTVQFRPDEFVGMPFASAVRRVLTARKSAMPDNAPASSDEILEALVTGGFEFDTKDDVERKRGLRVSLSKNTPTFRRIGDQDRWGLVEWYNGAFRVRPRPGQRSRSPAAQNVPGSSAEVAASSINVVDCASEAEGET
ncbi:hypothetical protein [Falsiroseomonas oryzae]|uniref:hypothetical protein n=1 Tax=Falsiroseomonas oryzae TaxID=2766473 RepID=UPI0022EA9C6E|nr:hypothetical protein [Roseomonas sp. MO-31]